MIPYTKLSAFKNNVFRILVHYMYKKPKLSFVITEIKKAYPEASDSEIHEAIYEALGKNKEVV